MKLSGELIRRKEQLAMGWLECEKVDVFCGFGDFFIQKMKMKLFR